MNARPLIMRAPAKINLGLTVLFRRTDGYHQVQSVLQHISLADTLLVRPVAGGVLKFWCSEPELSGDDNLVCRAAQELKQSYGSRRAGADLRLYKVIPWKAGLGGGSSDAAVTLRALNGLWSLNLDAKALETLGASLGSDIPYCLRGGTVLAEGRGEILTTLPSLPFFWVVLALPAGLSVSTATAYSSLEARHFAASLPLSPLIAGIKKGDRRAILNWFKAGPVNTLEEVVSSRYPEVKILQQYFQKLGLYPAMSGSGPAVFALSDSYRQAGQAVAALLQAGYRAYLCWTT